MLKLNTKLWLLHVIFLSGYFILWIAYEITYGIWSIDPNAEKGKSDIKLLTLAVVELCFNLISVFLSCILFYMLDHITR